MQDFIILVSPKSGHFYKYQDKGLYTSAYSFQSLMNNLLFLISKYFLEIPENNIIQMEINTSLKNHSLLVSEAEKINYINKYRLNETNHIADIYEFNLDKIELLSNLERKYYPKKNNPLNFFLHWNFPPTRFKSYIWKEEIFSSKLFLEKNIPQYNHLTLASSGMNYLDYFFSFPFNQVTTSILDFLEDFSIVCNTKLGISDLRIVKYNPKTNKVIRRKITTSEEI